MSILFQIGSAAEKTLLSSPDTVGALKLPLPVEHKEIVRNKIFEIGFDCTPNWGIEGVQNAIDAQKRNWYFQDAHGKATAEERLANIDIHRLSQIVDQVVKHVVDEREEVSGFGLYGSYFYRRNSLLPEDLDVFILVKNSQALTLDALRYEDPELRKIYKNKAKISPASQEMGFSIVSEDTLHLENRSYIVTDCSLLDISTTLSYGKTVKARPLPPFVLIQNAQKIIRW
jgi:predicted nucleotidyltransferase